MYLYLLRVGGGIGSCNSGIKRARLEEESGKGGMEGEREAPPHRALDTGQFRFWSKFKVPSSVQKWPH